MENMNRKPPVRWRETFPVEAALAAKLGFSDPKIALLLGLTPRAFAKWKQEHPVLKEALDMARADVSKGHAQKFENYVFQRLPARLQALWGQLMLWKDHRNGLDKIKLILDGQKKLVRQQLFAHAMIYAGYNVSEAGRIANVPLRTYNDWKKTDPQFLELLAAIEEYKKDFFENALINQVAAGNPSAVLFVNRTYNKDRGYSEKLRANVDPQNQFEGSVISIDELELPLETRRQLLDAIRAAKSKRLNNSRAA